MLPLTKNFFYEREGTEDGFAWWCKECWKDYEEEKPRIVVKELKIQPIPKGLI